MPGLCSQNGMASLRSPATHTASECASLACASYRGATCSLACRLHWCVSSILDLEGLIEDEMPMQGSQCF